MLHTVAADRRCCAARAALAALEGHSIHVEALYCKALNPGSGFRASKFISSTALLAYLGTCCSEGPGD